MMERTKNNLEMLWAKVNIDDSVAAQDKRYQKLKKDYAKACRQLTGKLDEKRLALFQEIMDLQGQIAYENELYYLWQGILRGTSLADKIEWDNGLFIIS